MMRSFAQRCGLSLDGGEQLLDGIGRAAFLSSHVRSSMAEYRASQGQGYHLQP